VGDGGVFGAGEEGRSLAQLNAVLGGSCLWRYEYSSAMEGWGC
jgi:hypothetical protein